jgi:hypothetical protein
MFKKGGIRGLKKAKVKKIHFIKGVFQMKVKAGSWSMLSQEEKLLLLTVISEQNKKGFKND